MKVFEIKIKCDYTGFYALVAANFEEEAILLVGQKRDGASSNFFDIADDVFNDIAKNRESDPKSYSFSCNELEDIEYSGNYGQVLSDYYWYV